MTTHPAHTAFEIGSVSLVISSIVGWLPPVAAALGILWYCILIYDRFYGKKD